MLLQRVRSEHSKQGRERGRELRKPLAGKFIQFMFSPSYSSMFQQEYAVTSEEESFFKKSKLLRSQENI